MSLEIEQLYWRLPHPLRQRLLKMVFPQRYNALQTLANDARDGRDGAFLRPFVENRCIYVHITKTAGTSVNAGLFGTRTGSHRKLAHYRAIFGVHDYDTYFKFAFVRNPWDRLVSAYLYLKQGGAHAGDRNWALQHLASYPTFDDFVKGWIKPRNIRRKNHFVPQVNFICLPGQHKIELDFTGSYENLQVDYDKVRTILGRGNPLPLRNVTPGKNEDFRSYYTSQTRTIVAEAYREDIELLGYTFHRSIPVTRGGRVTPRGMRIPERNRPRSPRLGGRQLQVDPGELWKHGE